jgi:hypothetical protein
MEVDLHDQTLTVKGEFVKSVVFSYASQKGSKTGIASIPSTQTPIAPQVVLNRLLSIISMEDQQVRAGLLIAMELAACGLTNGADAPVEVADKLIAISIPSDPSEVVAKAPQSRRNSKKKKAVVEPVPLEKLKFLTIAQTALRYQVHTEKALYHLHAQASAYMLYPKAGLRSNGFIECVFRPDGQRKILIIAEKYEQWLVAYSSQQLGATVHAASHSGLQKQSSRTAKSSSTRTAGLEAPK